VRSIVTRDMLVSVTVRHGFRVTLVGVTGGSHARPAGPTEREGRWTRLRRRSPQRPRKAWRIGTPAVVLLCGALFVVSAANSDGTDLRPGRYTDLASLVQDEADQYDALREEVADLNGQVAVLSAAMRDRDVNRYHRRIEKLRDPAGLTPRSGPGLSITLSDAPEDVINSTTGDVNRLVIHQQDIQAVVNALWKGGASAVTIAGQRIVTTTGIKCEGNSVQLQGVPYPQPFVIEAVGDPAALGAAIDDDAYVDGYREDANNPDIAVGWDMRYEPAITAPAYDGLLDLNFAQPLTAPSGS
jgi:uncharacterized protein YlxW (UPF0749 family)